MNGAESAGAIDRLFLSFIASRSREESGRLLGDLLELHLGPVIRGIIRRKLQLVPGSGRQDAEDVFGEAIVKLLDRLQSLKDDGTPPVRRISNLAGYTATIAYSVCDEYLRRKYPGRRRLKNRVQYLLTHRTEFGLWEADDGEWYGGFQAWRNRRSTSEAGDRLRRLGEHREAFEQAELGGRQARHESPTALVAAIFRWVDGPVELDALVNVLRDIWDVREEVVLAGADEEALERRAAPSARGSDVAEYTERHAFLSRLWSEICELPPRQRTAVLFNLRDENGCSALELFPLLGVATIRQIAAALEIPVSQFAGLWNDLPLDDARIAARLAITRQQVINLRKSARERLGRRVRDR